MSPSNALSCMTYEKPKTRKRAFFPFHPEIDIRFSCETFNAHKQSIHNKNRGIHFLQKHSIYMDVRPRKALYQKFKMNSSPLLAMHGQHMAVTLAYYVISMRMKAGHSKKLKSKNFAKVFCSLLFFAINSKKTLNSAELTTDFQT